MSPRVGRIRVQVEIVDDDGSATIHEAVGTPKPGHTPTISLVPHHRTQISRSQGTVVASEPVQVGVRVEARLVATPGHPLFTVATLTPEERAEDAPAEPIVLQISPSTGPALDV